MLAACKGLTLLFHPSNVALHFGPLAAIRLQRFGSDLEGKISVPDARHPYSSLLVLSHLPPHLLAQIFHASLPLVLTYMFPAAPLLQPTYMYLTLRIFSLSLDHSCSLISKSFSCDKSLREVPVSPKMPYVWVQPPIC